MTAQADASVPWLRVSVVIPALNEARNLPHVFARLPPDVHEVIVVDGHSVDDTISVVARLLPEVRIVLSSTTGTAAAKPSNSASASPTANRSTICSSKPSLSSAKPANAC